MLAGPLACKAPLAVNRMVRSSATSLAPWSISRSARSDLPAPLGPSSRTPRAPIAMQLAWIFTSAMVLRQRQLHDQPRPSCLLIGALLIVGAAILRIDTPARAFDDLAGDGKPQPGIASETLARPLGIEALENRFQVSRRNAGAFILHRDAGDDVVAAGGDRYLAMFRTEGDGIVDQVAEYLAQPLVAAAHDGARRQFLVQHEFYAAAVVGHAVDFDDGGQQLAQRHGLLGLARQFGVQPRGVGDVGDQPVDALDVAAHDLQQPGAAVIVFGAGEHLHRTGQ